MSDLLLAKKNLPAGTIDALVGEPYVIRDALYSLINIAEFQPNISNQNIFEYTQPNGYQPLVKFLEDKHQAPVIISSGAKQAIGSIFYALKCSDIKSIYLDKPWWSLFPPLINMHNLHRALSLDEDDCAYLLVSPNNPDGSVKSKEELLFLKDKCKEKNIPLIHDAAYHNYNYLPKESKLDNIGDVQIFTCSKLLGLSQLRIGYSVFYNTNLYNKTLEYMENMTVGTSILSQMFALNILRHLNDNKDIQEKFEEISFNSLSNNRNILKQISPLIIDETNSLGMFLWGKVKKPEAFIKTKINIANGVNFGDSSFSRLNLALKIETITEIVNRLNSV